MMADTGLQPTGAERAANVYVVAGSQGDGAESADADGAGAGAGEQQSVRAGGGREHGDIVERGAW
jgi:hypothetical protein